MSRSRRIAILAAAVALVAGAQVVAAPLSNAGTVVKATQGPVHCC